MSGPATMTTGGGGQGRAIDGRYVLVSARAVPGPGFPIRARVAAGEVTEMQTLGPPQPEPEKPDLILVTEALERVAALVASLSVSVAPLVSEFTERRAIERAEAALALMD